MTSANTPDTNTSDTSAQREMIVAQLAKVREARKSIRQCGDMLSEADSALYLSNRALDDVEFVLALLAKGADPAGIVRLDDYDESKYHYYDKIEDDPMWGIDWDPESETNPNWGVHDGRNVEYAYHLHHLGWLIRTAKRTPEHLAWLYKQRGWLDRCRAVELDPISSAGFNARDEYDAFLEACERALTDQERADLEARFTDMLREAAIAGKAENAGYEAWVAAGRPIYEIRVPRRRPTSYEALKPEPSMLEFSKAPDEVVNIDDDAVGDRDPGNR